MKIHVVLPTLAVAALALGSACSASSSDPARTVTVTRTVTAPAPAHASAVSTPTSALSPGEVGPDACTVLTHDEAQTLAGTPLMTGLGAGRNSSGAFVECQYTGPTSGPVAQVEVYVGDGAKQQLHIDRDNLRHIFTDVAGIGDQCLQEEGYIFVEKDGLWASIHLVRLDDPKLHVVPLQTAAKELVARLP